MVFVDAAIACVNPVDIKERTVENRSKKVCTVEISTCGISKQILPDEIFDIHIDIEEHEKNSSS